MIVPLPCRALSDAGQEAHQSFNAVGGMNALLP